MTKKQGAGSPELIGEDEILRRMLNTPPKQHDEKVKATTKARQPTKKVKPHDAK